MAPKAQPTSADSVEGKYGEKMIEVRVRFWTDTIASKDKVRPKHAWDSGVIIMTSNKTHGIKSKSPKPFHGVMDMSVAIEKVLIAHAVKLHVGKESRKLLVIE